MVAEWFGKLIEGAESVFKTLLIMVVVLFFVGLGSTGFLIYHFMFDHVDVERIHPVQPPYEEHQIQAEPPHQADREAIRL